MASAGRPPSRPGIPCLIPVQLCAGDLGVDGVITRISEMAASITLEQPFEASPPVTARFRRPGDREEIEVSGAIIGYSKEGGIWRGRPSVVLRFDRELRHATPSEPPEETEISVEDPTETPDWQEELGLVPATEKQIQESLSDALSDEFEQPVPTGPPVTAAWELPEPETYDFLEMPDLGGDEELDESTIDRLQHQLQRSERRILASLPVTFWASGEEYHGIACNFSPGGVYLAAESLPRIGTVVHLEFPLTNDDGQQQVVEFNGVVRWYRKDRPDLRLPDGFGLQIISFEQSEDRAVYNEFVDRIASQSGG